MSRELANSMYVDKNGELKEQNTIIAFGSDHALGRFIDILDRRYAGTTFDPQGEGYLVEWSDLFGFHQNKIGIKIEELSNEELIFEKVDKYLTSIGIIK